MGKVLGIAGGDQDDIAHGDDALDPRLRRIADLLVTEIQKLIRKARGGERRPAVAAIGGFQNRRLRTEMIKAGAVVAGRGVHGLAGGIGGIDGDRADRKRGLMIRGRRPGRPTIGRLPDTARSHRDPIRVPIGWALQDHIGRTIDRIALRGHAEGTGVAVHASRLRCGAGGGVRTGLDPLGVDR